MIVLAYSLKAYQLKNFISFQTHFVNDNGFLELGCTCCNMNPRRAASTTRQFGHFYFTEKGVEIMLQYIFKPQGKTDDKREFEAK